MPHCRVPRNSPGPAQLEVLLGDHEAVVALLHHRRAAPAPPRDGACRATSSTQVRRARAAPDPAAQLVQLRQAEALGVLDHHHRRVGHVDADLDHRGRHEHVRSRRPRSGHHGVLLLAGFMRPCSSPTRDLGQRALPAPRPSAVAASHVLELLGLLDQRIDDVGLAARLRARGAAARRRLGAPLARRRRCAIGVRPGGSSSTTEQSRSP